MFSSIVSFIVVFGSLSLLSWSLWTITVSQISSIEKAFGLSSSESGWLLTVWEIGYMCCTLFASYFGARAHLTRVIGISTVVCGISGFIFALPHFVVYEDSNSLIHMSKNETHDRMPLKNLCVNLSVVLNGTSSELNKKTVKNLSGKTVAYALFIIGMILQGASKAPCYPYSCKYVDDNVNKQKTGFYVGIISSIAVFGLALGYGVGSLVSRVYVTLERTTMSSTDTRYIGAWWLGFMLLSACTILTSVPMFCFPRKLRPDKYPQTKEKLRHLPHKGGFKHEMKHVVTTLATILRSSVYVFTLIGACLQVLSFSVFLGFEPKYMETQFSIPSWQANIVLGVVSITSYSIGCLIGGTVTRRWKFTPFQMLLLVILLFGFVTLLLLVAAFLGCEQQAIQDWPGGLKNATLSLPCDCSGTKFIPICGADGNNYYSPCHAGCAMGTQKFLRNCSVIAGGTAKAGLCKPGCGMVWAYSAIKFIMNLVDAVASIPVFIVFLRAAGEEHKALALGLSAAVSSMSAWLPGPVIGGKLIDSTCLIWNVAATSGKYCAFYNIEWQRFRLHGLMIGLRLVALTILCVALLKARKLKDWPAPKRDVHVEENGELHVEENGELHVEENGELHVEENGELHVEENGTQLEPLNTQPDTETDI